MKKILSDYKYIKQEADDNTQKRLLMQTVDDLALLANIRVQAKSLLNNLE